MITREDIFVNGAIDPTILEWATEEFVGLTEIADLLLNHSHYENMRLTKQYVFNLAKREDFPSPIPLTLSMGRIWLASAVREWADSHPPRVRTVPPIPTGRPPLHSPEVVQSWKLLAGTKTYTEIAHAYGVHPSTVSRAVRKEIL